MTEQNLDLAVLPIDSNADTSRRDSLREKESVNRVSMSFQSGSPKASARGGARHTVSPTSPRTPKKIASPSSPKRPPSPTSPKRCPSEKAGIPADPFKSSDLSVDTADESEARSSDSEGPINGGCQTDLSVADLLDFRRGSKGRGSLREHGELRRTSSKRTSIVDPSTRSPTGLARGSVCALLKRSSVLESDDAPSVKTQLGALLREGGLVSKASNVANQVERVAEAPFSTHNSLSPRRLQAPFKRNSLQAKLKLQSADKTARDNPFSDREGSNLGSSLLKAPLKWVSPPSHQEVPLAESVAKNAGSGGPSGEEEDAVESRAAWFREKGWVPTKHIDSSEALGPRAEGNQLVAGTASILTERASVPRPHSDQAGSPNMSNLPQGPPAAFRSALVQPLLHYPDAPPLQRKGRKSQEKHNVRSILQEAILQKVAASSQRILSVDENDPCSPETGSPPSQLPRNEAFAFASQFDSNASAVESSKVKSRGTTKGSIQSASKKVALFLRNLGTTQGSDSRKRGSVSNISSPTKATSMKLTRGAASTDPVGADLVPVALNPGSTFSAGDSSPQREAKKSEGKWLVARRTKQLGHLGALRYATGSGAPSDQSVGAVSSSGDFMVHKSQLPLDPRGSVISLSRRLTSKVATAE